MWNTLVVNFVMTRILLPVGLWGIMLLSCNQGDSKDHLMTFIQGKIENYANKKIHFFRVHILRGYENDTIESTQTDSIGNFSINLLIGEKAMVRMLLENGKYYILAAYPQDTLYILGDTVLEENVILSVPREIKAKKSSKDNELFVKTITKISKYINGEDTNLIKYEDLEKECPECISPAVAFKPLVGIISDHDLMNNYTKILERFKKHLDERAIFVVEVSALLSAISRTLPGKKIYEVDGIDTEGVKHSIYHYEGKLILLDIWATWCAPCKQSIPFLKKLHQEYSQKGLKIVGLSVDKNFDKWKETIKEENIDVWPQIIDTMGLRALSSLLNVNAIPTYFLLDSAKIILKKWVGFEEKYFNEMQIIIDSLIKEKQKV